MPVVIHDFPTRGRKPACEPPMTRKVICRQCAFTKENLRTGNGADALARAHSFIHAHDVEIRFSVIDCLEDVIRANDPRD